MLFNSMDYLLFFPVVVLVYFLIPGKVRYLWLLAASYFFYMCWNAQYALLMLLSTGVTYLSGLFIAHYHRQSKPGMKKACVALSFGINLAILIFFKYGNFLVENVNALLSLLGVQQTVRGFSVLLPVGISFYTFQALSYTMDVYRGELPAERNPFKYALFVSFFPQLVAGPIERSVNLLTQIQNAPPFALKKARGGLLLMAWGLFLKMVIADNIAMIVDPIFDGYAQYAGVDIALATVLFAFQIYCDFAGYSLIARGSADVMGFTLMENFKGPYLARNIGDFWRRWHISLTTWFRDYLYIPLGGNRKGPARKVINTLIVFLVSGLWHGANWTFIIWGLMNGVMLVTGNLTRGLRERWQDRLGVDRSAFSYRLGQRLFTFLLICVTWVFFRANTLGDAAGMFARMATDFQAPRLFSEAVFQLAGGTRIVTVLLLSIIALLAVDWLKDRGADLASQVQAQNGWFRWAVYLGLVLVILLYGVYGNLYAQTQFIYFQF